MGHVFMAINALHIGGRSLVEVSWAWPNNNYVDTRSIFIQEPEARARTTNQRHKQELFRLPCEAEGDVGLPAMEACLKLNAELAGIHVVLDSSGFAFSSGWLRQLYEHASAEIGFKIGGSPIGVVFLDAARHGIDDVALSAIEKLAPTPTKVPALKAAYFAWFQVAISRVALAANGTDPNHFDDERIGQIVNGIEIRGLEHRNWLARFISNSCIIPPGVELA